MARVSLESATSSSSSSSSKGKPAKPGSKSQLDQGQKIKLGIAIGAILIALLLMAWNFGLLPTGGGPTTPDVTEAEVQQAQEEVQQAPIHRNAPIHSTPQGQ